MRTAGVIGGHDFWGCDVTLKLLSEDYNVKILVPKFSWGSKTVINTGLMAGENLSYSRIDMDNPTELEGFVKNCDCLIHCGRPFPIKLKAQQGTVYVPVTFNTGNILKSLFKIQYRGKIIFLASVAAYNHIEPETSSSVTHKEQSNKSLSKKLPEKVYYHSEKVMDKLINSFFNDQIEIIVVAPAVVSDNRLINSRDTTLAGLQYLFSNRIENDRIFLRLMRRKLVNTMVNIDDLPDLIFSSIKKYTQIQLSGPVLSF